jgi:putative membrane protein
LLIDDCAPRSQCRLRRAARPDGRHVISTSLIVAAILGFLLVVVLIIGSGAAEVASAMLVLGWWLVPITLFHIAPLTFDALSWRELFPSTGRSEERPSLDGPRRPGILDFIWMRWIRDSVSSLLPVAGVGGDAAAARLANQRGVPGAQAAASMVADITVGAATQVIFVIAGVILLAAGASGRATATTAWALFASAAVFAAAIGAFVLVQHNSMFGLILGAAHRLAPKTWLSAFAGRVEAIDAAVVATYRRRFALARSSLLRLAGMAAGAGEIWLTTRLLNRPLSLTDALVLESLVSGVRAAAFMAPGGLGAQEGGLVVFGALFGLPPDLALAVALTKRVRELALGLPGLVAWQWAEGRHWLSRRADKASSAT